MLARTVTRCCRQGRSPVFARSLRRYPARQFATHPAAPPTSPGSTSPGMLAPFVTELDRIAPAFDIKGSQVQILETPTDFYETLLVRATTLV